MIEERTTVDSNKRVIKEEYVEFDGKNNIIWTTEIEYDYDLKGNEKNVLHKSYNEKHELVKKTIIQYEYDINNLITKKYILNLTRMIFLLKKQNMIMNMMKKERKS